MSGGDVFMIVDITGVVLLPGKNGKGCPGNGENPDAEYCCDECDYMRCCYGVMTCDSCKDPQCPRAKGEP